MTYSPNTSSSPGPAKPLISVAACFDYQGSHANARAARHSLEALTGDKEGPVLSGHGRSYMKGRESDVREEVCEEK